MVPFLASVLTVVELAISPSVPRNPPSLLLTLPSIPPSVSSWIPIRYAVQVSWADDPLPQWREGIGLSSSKERSSSKLLRAEVPLRRHGRGNRLSTGGSIKPGIGLDLPFKGREIVAYDDLL
uniref:Uncharacterized protein n=1 Tax=Nelumbo nucifera TaxID=4432 RepID=A0A822YJJ2_NELNU|nr:TPA_asm: hypothetical protein HUJ06_009996 [Nelumbo nucifera]